METNLAVLIDFENIAAGTEKEGLGRFDVEALMQRVKDKGRILVARSYADWGRFSRFKQALLSANVTMMELTSHGMQDKNRADIAMVVDALELAFTKDYIDTFVVVSGDSDFTPMVLKMRELNKRVIGCGTRKSTSRLLIQACDEFFFYDTIAKPKKTRARAPKEVTTEAGVMTLEQAFDLLEETLDGLQRENPDPPLASIVKTAMLRKSPDFSETDLGFASYARFLEAAQDAGIVKIVRDQKSGGYRVDSLDTDEAGAAPIPAAGTAGPYVDEWLPEDIDRYLEPLAEAGIDPLSAPTRMAVLEALHEVVADRKKRRRKATLPHVAEDVRKALRRTHPDLPLASIRSVLDVLLRAGQLIHRDGTAIRSAHASFRLQADPQALNKAFTSYCLAHLIDAGVDVSDSDTLAELFLGQADRRREIEENIAWLQAQNDGEAPTEEIDLDDLLVIDEAEAAEAPPADEAPAAEEPPAEDTAAAEAAEAPVDEPQPEGEAPEAAAEESEDKPKKKRKRTRRKKDEEAEAAASPAEGEPTAEPAPEAEAAAAEPAPEAPAEASAEAQAAPEPEKKPRRRTTRTRKKAAEPSDLESDLDKLLQPSE